MMHRKSVLVGTSSIKKANLKERLKGKKVDFKNFLKYVLIFLEYVFLHLPPYLTIPDPQALSDLF